jgi:calpain
MQSQKLFAQVVPQDQGFDDENYTGMFHFRFWQYGEWVDVVIDDRLPFWSDGRGLVYANNKEQPDEFWAPLLVNYMKRNFHFN